MRLKQSKEEAEEDTEAAAVAGGEVAGEVESSKVDDDSDGELGELEVKSGEGGELASSSSSSSSSVGGQRVWHPPVDTLAYLKESEYGDQAISLCFRVFNASHLPSPSMSTTSSRRTSSIVGTLDSLADLTQHVNSGLSHNTSSSSGSTSQMVVEGQDKVSLQVEVCGAPCDKRQWPVSKEVGNDGVRHMFDECFCCDIAEPRLALIKFSLLRKGIEVRLFFINIYINICVYVRVCVCAMFVVTPHSGRRVCILFSSPICLCGP
jgi:hypothetical protein